MKKELQKQYPTDYNLLMMQDFWQVYFIVLLIILLKEFIKLNVNTDKITKKCETCGIKYKYFDCFLEYTKLKNNLLE